MYKNRPSELSKKWIIDALFILMEQKRFEKISITEIVNRAGVSRLTFYRNFESKEQILLLHFDLLFDKYLESAKENSGDLHLTIKHCFEFWGEHTGENNLLIKNDLTPLLYQSFDRYLDQLLKKLGLLNEFSYFQKKFLTGGIISVMLEWVINPRGRNPDDMANMIMKICPSLIQESFKDRRD